MRQFFTVTGLILIVFAAGLVSRTILWLQAAGELGTVWNNVYDLTAYRWLTVSTESGRLLGAMFGCDPAPRSSRSSPTCCSWSRWPVQPGLMGRPDLDAYWRSGTVAGSVSLGLGVGRLRRGSEAGHGHRLLALLAGAFQEAAADLAVDPAEVVQEAVMHLLGLAEQRRPFLLDLAADVVGDLAGLLQRLLGLGGDVGPGLLGLLLGLLDDRVGADAGRSRSVARPTGPPPGVARSPPRRVVERRRAPRGGSGYRAPGRPAPLGLGVEVDGLLQARPELLDVGVHLVAVISAPDHPEGRRPLSAVLPGCPAGTRSWHPP